MDGERTYRSLISIPQNNKKWAFQNAHFFMLFVVFQKSGEEIIRWDGFAVTVALAIITAHGQNQIFVFFCFHAFGHRLRPQLFGQCKDQRHHFVLRTSLLSSQIHQEHTIQLDLIHMELAQGVQRGVTRAEVIHGYTEPGPIQKGNGIIELGQVFKGQAFQNLQYDILGETP